MRTRWANDQKLSLDKLDSTWSCRWSFQNIYSPQWTRKWWWWCIDDEQVYNLDLMCVFAHGSWFWYDHYDRFVMIILTIMIIVMWSSSRPDVCLCSWIPLAWTGSVASFQPWIRVRIIVMSLTHKYVEDHDNHDGDDDFHSIFALHTFILTSWIAVLMSST